MFHSNIAEWSHYTVASVRQRPSFTGFVRRIRPMPSPCARPLNFLTVTLPAFSLDNLIDAGSLGG
jgi:hypothetical protein